MKNVYTTCVKLLFFLFAVITMQQQANAQAWTISVCSGGPPASTTSNVYGPMYSTATANSTSREAVIYPASQLTGIAGGTLSSAYFHRATASGTMAGTPNFKIYLKEVSSTDWGSTALDWTTAITGATLVYDGNPASIVGSTAGWKNFPFSTNFLYSGSQNLAVFFEYKNTTASTAIVWSYEYTSPCVNTSNSNTTKYSNVTTGTLPTSLSSTNYRRPYIGFDFPCTNPPIPGNVTSTLNPACSGSSFTLSLLSGTSGGGQTYQWQSSPDSVAWTDIAGATNNTLTTSQTVTTYYRARVTCGGNTQNSAGLKLVTPALFPGGTYTINGNIATGGTNFQTFGDAVNAISCGTAGPIVFNVEPMTYNEQVIIPAISTTSVINTIKFRGNLATIAIPSTATSTNRGGIVLNGTDHVIIDSLNIDGSSAPYAWGIVLTNQADSNVISNCNITVSTTSTTSADHVGIIVNGSSSSASTSGNNGNGNLIANNTITGGYYGIYLYGSTTPYNQNNIVRDNTIKDFYYYSIYNYGQESCTISGNDISRPSRTTSSSYNVYTSTNNGGIKIEKNKIHDLFTGATSRVTAILYNIYIGASGTSTKQNSIENNLVYNINNTDGTIYGVYALSYSYWNFYHNTIVLDDAAATAGTTYAMYVYGTTGMYVKNNIIYVNRGGTGTKYCLYYSSTGVTASNNNDLYMGSTSGTNGIGYFTSGKTTLVDWQGTGFDLNSSSADPLFVGGGDYTPTEASINNIGASGLGVTTDITGATRGASPDPGAYEFSIAGVDASISWVAPVMPATIGSKTITVKISNTASSNITSINLSYTDGTTVQTQNFSGLNIAPLANQNLSFTTPYNVTGNVAFRAYINSVNGGTDLSQTNDTTTQSLCFALNGMYTINQNTSTSATNFASFTEAMAALGCGGVSGPVTFTVVQGSGPYTDKVVIPQFNGASATNTVTIKGNLETIAYNTSDANNRTAVILNGADHVIIDSLNIDVSVGTYGWGIVLMNQADSNIIRNCNIVSSTTSTASNYAGIVISGSATTGTSGNNGNGNLIEGNSITGGYYGIYLYGSTTAYNMYNKVVNNVVKDFYYYSIYNYGQQFATISKNDISRPTRTNFSSYNLYVSSNNGGIKVEKNRIHDLFASATTRVTTILYNIYVGAGGTATDVNRLENNLVYNINNTDGTIYGVYGLGYNYWNYYHNTIVLDEAAATAGITYGMYVYGSTAANVKNNVIYVARGGTGAKYCLYYSTTGVTSSNNNVLYMGSTGGTANGIGYYNNGYTTLADWKAANSAVYDQQSISVDPMFANPGATPADYTPTVSAVNNIGAPLGVTQDILDSTRSTTTPDPGAYEFSNLTVGPNMGAEALVTPGIQPNGCYTNAETVTIKIRNSSLSQIDFSTKPVTITVNVTGAVTQTLTTTINTGTLVSDGILEIIMPTTVDMSTPGVYTFNAYTTITGDANPGNDAMLPATRTKVALTAGTLTAPSAYCVTSPVNPTLSSTGIGGQTSLQWIQSSNAGSGYSAISGASSSPYTVTSALTQTMYYKLVATCGSSKDTSAAVTVVYNNPQVLTTTPASRCGIGTVSLQATGSAGTSLEWYSASTGGTALSTGNTFVTPSISTTTTYYTSATISGGGTASPILVTEMDLGTDDQLEIQNVSPNPIDVTGWKVAVSNSYTDITSVNANIQTLSGIMNPGDTKSWTDLSSASNYWGSNILWNPGAFPTYAGWAAILDNNNNIVDIVFLNWPSANIQAATITIGGTPITVGSKWSGNGIDQTTVAGTQSVSRQGVIDNNNAADFAIINLSINSTNPGMTLPFSGFACSSARTAVVATVTPRSSNAAGAVGTSECASATISGSTEFNFTDCDLITTVNPSGATPISGSVNACVKIDASVLTAPTGETYVQRHYDITPTSNPTTATSTVTLYFLQSEFNAFNASRGSYPALPTASGDATGKANLRITQFKGTGTAPGNYTGGATYIDPVDASIVWNSTDSRWEVTFSATGGGAFYVHTGSNPLPVTILSFRGEKTGESNRLLWSTSTETNNKGFELQRSADGKSFTALTFVSTKSADGNSNTKLDYSYTDAKPLGGNNYYRLKQVDRDGKFSYSDIVLLKSKISEIMISSLYPNPAKDELNLIISSPSAEKLTIVLTDLSGKVVMQKVAAVAVGDNQQQLNVSSLAAGTYVVKAICANGCETAVHRFVKQ